MSVTAHRKRKPRKAVKKVTRRQLKPKTRCGGRWTEARYRSFIVSALRGATMRWAPKHDCIKSAYIGKGRNPASGRMCKLHRCTQCSGIVPQNKMKADHILPVVDPAKGFETWDIYIARMFTEEEGYQAICTYCHASKTAMERAIRTGKKQSKPVPRSQSPRNKPRRKRRGIGAV